MIRVSGDRAYEFEDLVASEKAVTLLVNGISIVSLLCSPADLEALAVGFLLSEGLLTERKELLAIKVDEAAPTIEVTLGHLPENWEEAFHSKTLTSGCGKGITFTSTAALKAVEPVRSRLVVSPDAILELLKEFRSISTQFQQTGGVHSAALATEKKILFFAEDIGRHNAVDKLIGRAFLAAMPMTDKILLSSGRISGEIMTKVIRNRIPILVSRTAPTCMAVTEAEDYGITLIGFARHRRMNIYSHPQRLLLPDKISAPDRVD
ncbi:MAG: formate dehydrogenase accessory sulfurtransferase FdhD [Deltaproteobacteria bacterium]